MVNQLISRVFTSSVIAIATETTIVPTEIVIADTTSADYIFLLDDNSSNCEQIGEGYGEIRAFETESFYINICQRADSYYYIGEAKTGVIGTIFLPANALAPGEMYRANNGNVAYIVTILPDGAILTIERNGAQIAVESSQNKQCLKSGDISSLSAIEPLYYPMSDTRILSTTEYIRLNPIQTVELYELDNFNSADKDRSSAILNIPFCD